MYLVSYLTINLGISIPQMGMQKCPVGQFVLTNVGTLKIQQGIAPLCPPTRSTGFACAGMVEDMPTVVDGEIKSQKIMKCSHTVDHRMWNTAIFAEFMNSCKNSIEKNPDFAKI